MTETKEIVQKKKDDILKELETLKEMYKKTRAYFPALGKDMIKEESFKTASLYQNEGFEFTFVLDFPLTESDIDYHNAIGHWHNQNFIIRLSAFLEKNNIVEFNKTPDKNTRGGKEVDLVKNLRHIFAHGSECYEPANPNSSIQKTHENAKNGYNEIFDIKINKGDLFPIPIDTIIYPLIKGCKKYSEEKLKD